MHLQKATYTLISCLIKAAIWSSDVVSAQSQRPLIAQHGLIQDIPPIGLGLWNSKTDEVKDAVSIAFDTGYKHLDSAAAYGNEKSVGKVLSSKSSPSRSSYWITSKLWNDMHQPDNVPKALNRTLSDLGVDYLDLYLMHWPVAFLPDQKPGRNIIDQDISITETWRAMSSLVSKNRTHPEPGTTRYIGISNFSPRQIDQILSNKDLEVKPYAHEFETHPWLQQQEFVDWHFAHDIRVIAYSPLANLNPSYKNKHTELPRIIDDEFFHDLAKNHSQSQQKHKHNPFSSSSSSSFLSEPQQQNKNNNNLEEEQKKKKKPAKITAAQMILAWNLSRNVTVIPKSVHEMYIVENFLAADPDVVGKLSREEMVLVAGQDKKVRFNDPSSSWGVKLFEGLDGV